MPKWRPAAAPRSYSTSKKNPAGAGFNQKLRGRKASVCRASHRPGFPGQTTGWQRRPTHRTPPPCAHQDRHGARFLTRRKSGTRRRIPLPPWRGAARRLPGARTLLGRRSPPARASTPFGNLSTQRAVMPAILMTLPQRSRSSRRCAANSFGVLPTASLPSASSLVTTSGLCIAFATSDAM